MKSHGQLVAQFYSEFPNAVGRIVFRNAKNQYPDVATIGLRKNQALIDHLGNVCLSNPSENDINKQSWTVALKGDPVFLNSFALIFNTNSIHADSNLEQEYIFHHETYHAIRYALQGLKTHDFKSLYSAKNVGQMHTQAYV
jgi:hypothetical protein